MNIKKLVASVLSLSLIVSHVAYAEGESGSAPSVDYSKVASYFEEKRNGLGDASGQFVYSRGDIKGKKRVVYVFNLPGNSGINVARLIQGICYDHLGYNPKNSTRKDTANMVVKATGGAAASLTAAMAYIAAADIPQELEIIRLPVLAICGGCCCCCSCLACCAGCTSCGIKSKSKDIEKIENKLKMLIEKEAFLNSNVLIIAFDKRDSCCCRKGVYVGFKHIDGLDETIAPIVRSKDYFRNIKFDIEIFGIEDFD